PPRRAHPDLRPQPLRRHARPQGVRPDRGRGPRVRRPSGGHTAMNTRSQLACAWASVAGVGLLLIGFFIVSGYLPPPHANASAQTIADFSRDHTTRIRIGLLLTFIAWGGWGALVAVLTIQLGRVEGKRPVLSVLQLASGIAGWACLLIPTMLLAVATYRPERS